jgi:hypothetical protein
VGTVKRTAYAVAFTALGLAGAAGVVLAVAGLGMLAIAARADEQLAGLNVFIEERFFGGAA